MIEKVFLIAWGAIVMMYRFSCSEELPPRNDPSDLFVAGTDITYNYSIFENSMRVELNVTNLYDETLEDTATLAGSLTIQLVRNRSYSKKINFTAANAQFIHYDAGTRVLRIDPKERIVFQQTWDFVDDQGRDLRTEVFRYVKDTTCPLQTRKIALPEFFVVQGTFKVFGRVTEVEIKPASFEFCHVNIWVLPRDCPPISPGTACIYVKPK